MKTKSLLTIAWCICAVAYSWLTYWALVCSQPWLAWRFIVCSSIGSAFVSICVLFLVLSDHLKHKSYENKKQTSVRDP